MNLPNRVPKVDSRQHSPLDGLSTSSNESSASLDSEDEDDFFQLEKDGFPLKPSSTEKEAPSEFLGCNVFPYLGRRNSSTASPPESNICFVDGERRNTHEAENYLTFIALRTIIEERGTISNVGVRNRT